MPERKDFIALFKSETEERLAKINNGLVELEKNPKDWELVKEINRQAHTIKGSSRVFGYTEIQDIAHKIEDIFEKIAKDELEFNSRVAENMFKDLDNLKAILEKIGKEGEPTAKELQPAVETEEYIRVSLSRVNKILNLVGEMVISKIQSSQKVAEARRLVKLSKEIQKGMEALTGVPEVLSQCQVALERLKEGALNLYERLSSEVVYLEPVIDELQNKAKELRMLPCSTIFEGFARMLRDIAVSQGKEINLEISGEETELDKKVLEGIKPALIHLLRNCIDHGIEIPKERQEQGKPKAGTIKLSAFQDAGRVMIVVEDDGKGLDIEEIKQTALKKNLVSSKELEEMSEKEILNIIFMDGYSTSQVITAVSGRGIGLDIVQRDIQSLKGEVLLESQKNKGSKFTLALPLTIAVTNVLLVKAKENKFAFPMVSVVECLEVEPKEISTLEGRMAIQVREHTVPIVRLDDVLGIPFLQTNHEPRATNHGIPVVIASSFEKRIGFIVDDIVGEEEIFIKSLGEHLGKVKNVGGATILGSGEVIVILDIVDLMAASALAHPVVYGRRLLPKEKQAKRILVVEDALTTREFIKSILGAQGYLADTAVDGLDALDRLAQNKYDLVITDIKMPRMDGFQLCLALKKNDAYKDIPVAIVTTLEKEEDKRKGIEVGACAYIVKSAFDQRTLLDTVERLL